MKVFMDDLKDRFLVGDCIEIMQSWPSKCVDLVIGSPPYADARTYGIAADRKTPVWVKWMKEVTLAALRISRGPVLWVVAGVGNYHPGPEGLVWEMYQAGVQVLRPCMWIKNAPPTGKNWFSNDWEFVLAFTPIKPVPYFDSAAIATDLKYSKGGRFRQRNKDGQRIMGSSYPAHKMRKRPSNVFHVTVGGGHMGHPCATENEAPFPVGIVRPFIKVLCPPGGLVCDPFMGSGTTAQVCYEENRHYVGIDLRKSQVKLAEERLRSLMESERRIPE